MATEKKITILTIGTRGDIHPFVALAIGLKQAGYQVKVATHDEFKSLVESYGLGFYPVVGSVSTSLMTDSVKSTIDKGGTNEEFFDSLTQEARPSFEQALINFRDACEDAEVILTSPFSLHISYYLSEFYKVPLIFCTVNPAGPTAEFHHVLADPPKGPNITKSVYNKTTHKIFTEVVWKYVKTELEPVWNKLFPVVEFPKRDPLATAFEKKLPLILNAFSPSILPKPQDWSILQHVTGYWWLPVNDEHVPPSVLVKFVENGEPPIYVGFGSMINPNDDILGSIVIPALKALGQRAVILKDGSDLSAFENDPDILLIDHADFNWLFPRMKALVHHGGAGTIGFGMKIGIPTLTVTFIPDQRFWSWKLSQMGVMPQPIPKKDLSYKNFYNRLKELISNPEFKNNTKELSLKINQEDGVKTAVEAIQYYLVVIKEHFAKEKANI